MLFLAAFFVAIFVAELAGVLVAELAKSFGFPGVTHNAEILGEFRYT